MSRVVVDASVVLAGLIASGTTRRILLGRHDLEFYVPSVIVEEVRRHLPIAVQKSKIPAPIVEELAEEIFAAMQVVPAELFSSAIDSAKSRCSAAGAHHDELYVALADVLDAPIWTFDKDFERVAKVRVVSVEDMLSMVDRSAKRKDGEDAG